VVLLRSNICCQPRQLWRGVFVRTLDSRRLARLAAELMKPFLPLNGSSKVLRDSKVAGGGGGGDDGRRTDADDDDDGRTTDDDGRRRRTTTDDDWGYTYLFIVYFIYYIYIYILTSWIIPDFLHYWLPAPTSPLIGQPWQFPSHDHMLPPSRAIVNHNVQLGEERWQDGAVLAECVV
jgi:hypothetical protein